MKWVVAVDGSEHAMRAATYAFSLAQHIPSITVEICSVDATEQKRSEVIVTEVTEEIQQEAIEQFFKQYEEVAESFGVPTTTHVLSGVPKRVLRDYMNAGNGDHLFIGSRGLNGFEEFVLGSVSHSLMKHVNVPVTIVK